MFGGTVIFLDSNSRPVATGTVWELICKPVICAWVQDELH